MNAGNRVRGLAEVNFRIDLQRLAEAARQRHDGPLAAILDSAVRTLDERIRDTEAADDDLSLGETTAMVCRNIRIAGKRTSLKLESEFWRALEQISQNYNRPIDELCCDAARYKGQGNLASALRVFILLNIRGV